MSLPALRSLRPLHSRVLARSRFVPSHDHGDDVINLSPPPIHWSGGFLVPNTQAVVIERFGKYPKVKWPGIRRLIPFVDKIVNVVSLREKTIHIPAQNATTSNSIPLSVSAEFTMRISDPVLASYEVDNPVVETIALAQRTLRSVIGQVTFEHIVQNHGYFHNCLIFALIQGAGRWGIACGSFEINDIAVSPEFKKALEDRKAEKQKRGVAEVLSISSNALTRAYGLEGKAIPDTCLLRASQFHAPNRT